MNSTEGVIESHIRRFREGNIDGVLDDFSPDAVLFTPSGVLRGRSEIKTYSQAAIGQDMRRRTWGIYEQNNLDGSCRIQSESGYDLGGDAALLSRRSASAR